MNSPHAHMIGSVLWCLWRKYWAINEPIGTPNSPDNIATIPNLYDTLNAKFKIHINLLLNRKLYPSNKNEHFYIIECRYFPLSHLQIVIQCVHQRLNCGKTQAFSDWFSMCFRCRLHLVTMQDTLRWVDISNIHRAYPFEICNSLW